MFVVCHWTYNFLVLYASSIGCVCFSAVPVMSVTSNILDIVWVMPFCFVVALLCAAICSYGLFVCTSVYCCASYLAHVFAVQFLSQWLFCFLCVICNFMHFHYSESGTFYMHSGVGGVVFLCPVVGKSIVIKFGLHLECFHLNYCWYYLNFMRPVMFQ